MANILVIDDEKDIRDLCADLLQVSGHDVDKAQNGEEALNYAKAKKYHLAIVDIVLPGNENGFDIIEKLKKMAPKLRIIAFTGYGGADMLNQSIKSGADELIAKPFWAKNLIEKVDQLTRLAQ